jgi:hypothetical protein
MSGGLALAAHAGSGAYILNAGKLATADETIGTFSGGIGTFTQRGGMNVVGNLDINFDGHKANPNDVYNLSGGVPSAGTITNIGTFNYSGGTLTGIFSNYMARILIYRCREQRSSMAILQRGHGHGDFGQGPIF